MSNTIKQRGDLPPYIVRGLKRDKNGIYTGTVVRAFRVAATNQKIDPLWLDPSQAPAPWGLPCVDATADINPPVCLVTYNYEGVTSNFTFSEDEVTFELDTSMSEEPIETHPKFDQLKKIYGWDQDNRRFAETLSDNTGGTALSGKKEKGKVNPLFGIDSWLVIGAIYRKTYASRTIPGNIFNGIGTIVKRPPDIQQFRLPADSRKRNWLYLAPKVSRTGNSVRITQEWMLSGPKGWATPIYSAGQLGDGSGPGDGLTTGSL